MPTILITGANRGIGFEFTKQYAADKWTIVACCRDPGKAKELRALAKVYPSIQIEALDVTDDASIAALAARLKEMPIDVLVNNAGINSADGKKQAQEFGHIDPIAWEKVLRVNTIAPIMMIQAFALHLQKGTVKKIINISSIMSSMAALKRGRVAYRSSKTALNSAMRAIVQDLRELGLTVVNFHPGWVVTDMGGQDADLTTEESVSSMRQVIDRLKLEDSGQFLNYDGHVIPW